MSSVGTFRLGGRTVRRLGYMGYSAGIHVPQTIRAEIEEIPLHWESCKEIYCEERTDPNFECAHASK